MGHPIASHDTLCDGESLGTLHKLYTGHCPRRSRCHWRKWQKNIGLNKLNPGFESDLESLNSKCNKRRSSMIVGWETWFMIYELFALRTDCLDYWLVKSARLETMRYSRWLVHYALMILDIFGCPKVSQTGGRFRNPTTPMFPHRQDRSTNADAAWTPLLAPHHPPDLPEPSAAAK